MFGIIQIISFSYALLIGYIEFIFAFETTHANRVIIYTVLKYRVKVEFFVGLTEFIINDVIRAATIFIVQ